MKSKEEFSERYRKDGVEVTKYKERLRYKKFASRGMFLSPVLIFIASWITQNWVAKEHVDIALWVSAFLIFSPGLPYSISKYYTSNSSLTAEAIAYHELVNAIRAYEQNHFKDCYKYLQECNHYINHRDISEIPFETRDSLVNYIESLEVEDQAVEKIEQTFGEVYPNLIKSFAGKKPDEIDRIAEKMENRPSAKISGCRRAKADTKQLVNEILFGFWGIVVGAFVAGYFVFNFIDERLGAGIIGAILTVYGLHLRRDE